jgi:hypothetical protein
MNVDLRHAANADNAKKPYSLARVEPDQDEVFLLLVAQPGTHKASDVRGLSQ